MAYVVICPNCGATAIESEHIMAEPETIETTPAWQARMLLRAARAGTLATSTSGQPFASLVTPACGHDLSVLLFLSELSEHTRHLRAEPRCSLLVAGPAESANPQTAPRLTLTGLAAPEPDPALKARWLAVHPYAQLYAEFGDFALWRIRPAGGLLVGGFARATRLKSAELLPDPAHAAAMAAAEADIIAHSNADHPDAMAAIGTAATGTPGAWRMATADLDGCDLVLGERVIRVPWRAPVSEPMAVRGELIRLVRAARAQG
jgi:putative heme iron utilization protein